MSSGGWELVGKNKKDKSNGKPSKLTKAEKKRFIENAPKVEDFLPLTQVKTLYDNLDSNKENKKPQKDNKSKENQEKKKQQQKQQQQQTAEPKKQKPKEKLPKSVQEGLIMIDVEELNQVLSASQARFSDAPVAWLKDLAAYLSSKLPADKEDAVFSGRPKDFPLSAVTDPVRAILERALIEAGPRNTQLFFDNCLSTMPSEMVKGAALVGHKILLQLVVHNSPEIMVSHIPKLITVRNSYQNRKPIGLSLLWLMAQAGQGSLDVGLRVWSEVMAPMLETKNYASHVAQILSDLVTEHQNRTDLKVELYLTIVDDVYSGKFNVPGTVSRDLGNAVDKLRLILFKNKSLSSTKLFEMLMGKITPKVHANYRDELIKALAACLSADSFCFSIWRSLYAKNLYQSQLLFTYITAKWSTLSTSLNAKCLKETCLTFQVTNERWKKGRDENLASSCSELSKSLLAKMTASNERTFPWGKASFLLLVLIGAIVAYDVRSHGTFDDSSTGKFLLRSGVAEYGHKAWTISQQYVSDGLEATEARYPEYYKAVVDAYKPYRKLFGDVYIVMRSTGMKMYDNAALYAKEQGPVVVATIEHYFPGMLEQIRHRSIQGMEIGKEYLNLTVEKISEHSRAAIKWLESNVFVGKLSPQNLQSYANQAIDTTQALASQTYDWVYEKMQTFSKVP